MPEFDKKEQLEFVSKMHASLKSGDSEGLLSLYMTMDEISSIFKSLKIDRDINKEFKRSKGKAITASENLLNFINNQVGDFSSSEIIDIEAEVQDISGILGTGNFGIIFKTPRTYFKIGISEVICTGGRLFWNGDGISYITNEEPFEKAKPKKKNNEFKEANLVGKFQEKLILDTEFNSLNYIEYAHKQARVYESLKVKGDLDLNQLYSEGIYTILVKQDLIVTGNIVNDNGNIGSSLFVLGETRSNNLIAGGSIISLNKAIIKDFTVGFYNDGYLSIESLCTDILLSFDHHTVITDYSNIMIYLDSFNDEIDVEDNLDDMSMLAKYFNSHKELSKMVTREEEDCDIFYYLDYDLLNQEIMKNRYSLIQKSIHGFAQKYNL